MKERMEDEEQQLAEEFPPAVEGPSEKEGGYSW